VAAYPAWNSTLWGIAQKEYGSGSDDTKIWNANQSLIEGQEIKHGMTKAEADSKKWLYPGEVLTIP
jgi:nucleoid-associated protein YgaU